MEFVWSPWAIALLALLGVAGLMCVAFAVYGVVYALKHDDSRGEGISMLLAGVLFGAIVWSTFFSLCFSDEGKTSVAESNARVLEVRFSAPSASRPGTRSAHYMLGKDGVTDIEVVLPHMASRDANISITANGDTTIYKNVSCYAFTEENWGWQDGEWRLLNTATSSYTSTKRN